MPLEKRCLFIGLKDIPKARPGIVTSINKPGALDISASCKNVVALKRRYLKKGLRDDSKENGFSET